MRLYFECYRVALQAWLKSGKEKPRPSGVVVTVHTTPKPRCHTALDKVTCRLCWREIRRMVRERALP